MKDLFSRFSLRPLFAFTLAFAGAISAAQVSPAWTWTRSSNDAANDAPGYIQVDSSGNIFAAGTNYFNPNTFPTSYGAVAKVGPDGTQKWVKTLADAAGIQPVAFAYDALDSQGDVFVSGNFGNDLLTLKYDGNGNLLWKKTYTSVTAGFRVAAETPCVSDGSGGVYVTGLSFPQGSSVDDMVICHYDAGGNLKFSNETLAGGFFRTAVDTAGNLVMAGTVVTPANLPTCLIWKLDPNGNTIFKTTVGQGYGQSILLDSTNNVYATIVKTQSSLVEYSPTGTQILSPQPLDGPSEIRDMHFDSQGSIIASGYYNRDAGGGVPSFGVWKLTNAGQMIWRQIWNYPTSTAPSLVTCAVDSTDNVYVMSNFAAQNADFGFYFPHSVAILKMDKLGNKLWPDSGGAFSAGAYIIPNLYVINMIPSGAAGLLLGAATENLSFTGRIAVVELVSQQISALSISPNTQWSEVATTGTVTLNTPAPTGGTVLTLSGGPGIAVPADVTVAAGQTSAQFTVRGLNTTYATTTGTVTATLGSSVLSANFSIKPPDFAVFVDQTIPTSMIAGQSYPISVRFANRGGITWTTAHGYDLQSQSPVDNLVWGTNRLALSNGPVQQGSTAVFAGSVIAPATPGTYPMSWRPNQEGIGVFGPLSPAANVKVVAAGMDGASLNALVASASVESGHDFNGSAQFINTGSTTWAAA